MNYSLTAERVIEKIAVLARTHPHKEMEGLLEGEMFIMNYLTFKAETASPGELSSALGTSTARIAAILNSLERKGWITREIDKNDRRRILVARTETGKQFIICKTTMIKKMAEKVLEELGEHDAKEAMRILDRLIDIYKNTNAHTPDTDCAPADESV